MNDDQEDEDFGVFYGMRSVLIIYSVVAGILMLIAIAAVWG